MFERRLTRFEKAKIVAARYMMLIRGAPPLVDPSGKDAKEIAYEELVTRKLPLTLIRLRQTKEGFSKELVNLRDIEIIEEDELGEIRCSRALKGRFLPL